MANAMPAATCSMQPSCSHGCPRRQSAYAAAMQRLNGQANRLSLAAKRHLAAYGTNYQADPSHDQQQPVNAPPPERACTVQCPLSLNGQIADLVLPSRFGAQA